MTSMNDYINNVKRINTFKEALQHLSVRYSTFIQNYPKDCPLPGCTLAQNGFYYDSNTKSIRCIECIFSYDNLLNDSLMDILSKHYRQNKICSQAIKSIDDLIKTSLDEIIVLNTDTNRMQIDKMNLSPGSGMIKKNKNPFASEESRLKTFDGARVLFNTKQLVANGFYRVVKDQSQIGTIKTNTMKANLSGPITPASLIADKANLSGSIQKASINKIDDDQRSEPTQIEQIAPFAPSLYHIKCAFCSYECLIFKNSLLNTMYKSPFDEHREKSKETNCPMFPNDNSKIDNTPFEVNTLKKLDWLQKLYDLDDDGGVGKKSSNDDKEFEPDKDNLVLKHIPKVVDYLCKSFTPAPKNNQTIPADPNAAKSSDSETAFVYVPKSGSSDFNKLQSALNQSDNVISERAYHSAYLQYQTRLDSFKEWPATLSQQPADLARAGFYYFGIKDMVKCFFCNGGLKNWDQNDDPYQDHVRWFPKCQFIRQLMGADYVEQVREKYKNMDSGFTNETNSNLNNSNTTNGGSSTGTSSSSSNKNSTNRSKRAVSPRTLNSRMDTYIIRKILDTNLISRDSIRQSIEMRLSQDNNNNNSNNNNNNPPNTTGQNVYSDDFKSPFDMATVSYELDKSKQEKIDSYKAISDLMICNIPNNIKSDTMREIIQIKYSVYPQYVRMIKEEGASENRSFCFITLKKTDQNVADEIIRDFDRKPFPTLDNSPNNIAIAFKTNWIEIEEKIKPLIGKSTTVSGMLINHEPIGQMTTASDVLNTEDPMDISNDLPSKSGANKEANEEEEMNDDSDDKQQLMEENERLKSERLCVICLSKDKNVLFLPCAHLAACLDCSLSLQNCPMCRAKIQASVRTFS